MALTKVTQAYLSIASVFLLTIVGSGAFILQSDSGPISHADTSVVKTSAILSLDSPAKTYATGDTFSVNITGQFSGEPISSAQILLSYPSKAVELVSVDNNGELGQSVEFNNDIKTGTLSMSYLPLTGYIGSGGQIASVKFKALSASQVNIALEIASQIQGLKPTTISTITKKLVPETKNITIKIK